MEWNGISAWRYTYNFSQGVAWQVSISISEKRLDSLKGNGHALSGTN
jgi:hypothetical protein